MLQELYITNFALIDKVTINLSEGLNVFSGATGVGKSMVIGALNFILGGRVSSDIVRSGKDEAAVVGKFYIKDKRLINQIKKLCDTSIEEELLLQRGIDTQGRSKCRLNNVPITVSMLKEIGENLVNIHGQHEHETLLHGINQLYILDDFGGIASLREGFSELFKEYTEKIKLRDILLNNQQDRLQTVDLYSFQIDEITKTNLKPGEIEELEKERTLLSNAEKIYTAVSSCYSQIYESSDAVLERLKSVIRDLQSIAKYDETLSKLSDACSQSLYQIEDAAFSLGKYRDGFNFDPQRLEYIEDRLNTIRKLQSKYGNTIEEIIAYRDTVVQKLKQVSSEGVMSEHIDEEIEKLSDTLRQKGRELTQKRVATANKLSSLITEELHSLGMPHGKFLVQITSPFSQNQNDCDISVANGNGFDQIDFLISPNPGEELKPLKKIASGGEISRVMLALKHQLAKVDRTPVLVFDEIDANIGGRMGEVIGEKLSSIARSHQVVCITHLPQIASYGDEQYKVNKLVKNGKTYSTIENVTGEARLEEIADMIRGSEKTDITRKQAQEMLRDARKKTKNKGL